MENGIRILIACEESDEVRGRFEQMGFDAWSCDLPDACSDFGCAIKSGIVKRRYW